MTDPDGTPHPLRGPGDVVVLPKGWYGRWDITEHIHKIWLTLTHDDVPGASLRPEVFAAASATPATPPGRGSAAGRRRVLVRVRILPRGVLGVRPRRGVCVCAPREAAELFHVLEGEMFVVEEDGATARRCVAGDLVFLPEGWRGSFHVQERGAKAAAVRVGGGRGRGRGGGGEGRRGRHLRRGVSDRGARRVEAGVWTNCTTRRTTTGGGGPSSRRASREICALNTPPASRSSLLHLSDALSCVMKS